MDAVGELQHVGVGQVGTVVLDDIQKTEAELELGHKLEERQIDVATHANLKIEVEGLEQQLLVLACGKVNHGIDTGYDIGTEIVVARSSHLEVDGHGDVGALDDLRGIDTAVLLVEDGMLLTEMNGGRHTQREVVVESPLAEHTYGEAGAVVVDLGVPLLTTGRIDEAIVAQFEVLQVHAKEEAIVKLPLVDVRAVLYLALLGCQAEGKDEDEKGDKAPHNVGAHQFYNVEKGRFIAQITNFNY